MAYCRNFYSMLLIFLLGIWLIGCGGKAEIASGIPVPDGGFTIVLREPMRENPRVVKVDENAEKEPIQGFTVSLPENTPVFFRVDQVNTILYDIKITVKGEQATDKEQAKDGNALTQLVDLSASVSTSLKVLKVISESLVEKSADGKIERARKTLKTLQGKLQAAKALNSKLDELLYESEMPEFRGFEYIQTQATKDANGTAEKFYNEGEAALAAVHQVYNDVVKDDKSSPVLKKFPVLTELSDPSKGKAKDVLNVFAQTAKKLRMIETARWRKDDTQERVLKEDISYTCVISPVVKLPEKYPQLRTMEFVVVVNRTPNILGRQVTFGSFLTHLHDDTYVNVDKKIEIGVQDRFGEGFAVLTHVPLHSWDVDRFKFLKFKWAPSLSGGLGISSISDSGGKFSLEQLPTMLGASLLFAAPKSESLLALTIGGTLSPVKRLNGYSVGNTFPSTGGVTRPVRTFGLFFAITISYDIRRLLKQTSG